MPIGQFLLKVTPLVITTCTSIVFYGFFPLAEYCKKTKYRIGDYVSVKQMKSVIYKISITTLIGFLTLQLLKKDFVRALVTMITIAMEYRATDDVLDSCRTNTPFIILLLTVLTWHLK
jgi:hypothetical protein